MRPRFGPHSPAYFHRWARRFMSSCGRVNWHPTHPMTCGLPAPRSILTGHVSFSSIFHGRRTNNRCSEDVRQEGSLDPNRPLDTYRTPAPRASLAGLAEFKRRRSSAAGSCWLELRRRRRLPGKASSAWSYNPPCGVGRKLVAPAGTRTCRSRCSRHLAQPYGMERSNTAGVTIAIDVRPNWPRSPSPIVLR